MINEELYASYASLSLWPRVEGVIDLIPKPPRDWPQVTVERLQELLAGLHRL